MSLMKKTTVRKLVNRLKKMNDRLSKPKSGFKMKSTLNKGKRKSNIPGFTYWFKK